MVFLSLRVSGFVLLIERGDVSIYAINVRGQTFSVKLSQKFSQAPWGITPLDTGSVSCIAWNEDENAIAIGTSRRGLTVWSIYGCRLLSTIPQKESNSYGRIFNQLLTLSRMDTVAPMEEPARSGISSLCWGPMGYHLLCGPGIDIQAARKSKNHHGTLMQLSFLKSCQASNPSFVCSISPAFVLTLSRVSARRLCFKAKTGCLFLASKEGKKQIGSIYTFQRNI
jgi:hypothetical protein